jgi:hypothetical protein
MDTTIVNWLIPKKADPYSLTHDRCISMLWCHDVIEEIERHYFFVFSSLGHSSTYYMQH